MNKEVYNFFKECKDIENARGGCIMVAKNTVAGYGCNGIFQIIEVDNGFKLIKEVDGMVDKQDFNFEDVIFNENTIHKVEFGTSFGRYANVYLDEHNYIHIHIKLLD